MITIPAPSTDYGLFSHGEFADVVGRVYTVQVEKKGYTGSVIALKYSGTPVIITQHGGESTETSILPQELTLSIISDGTIFYSGNNFEYRCQIITENKLIWLGYLVPDQWTEAFLPPPFEVQLRFVDGLSMLKNFAVEDEGGYLVGRTTWLNLIAFLLSKLDKGCDIVDAINILEERATNDQRNGYLNDTIIDTQAFQGLTCYEALERLLYPLMQIIYVNNKYVIKRIIQPTAHIQVCYNYSGNWLATTTTDTSRLITCSDVAPADRLTWINDNQQLEYLPAKKEINISHRYGLKKSIIPRWDFASDDFADGKLKGWSTSNIGHKKINEKDYAEFIEGDFGSLSVEVTPNYIKDDDVFIFEITQRFGTIGLPSRMRRMRVRGARSQQVEAKPPSEAFTIVALPDNNTSWRIFNPPIGIKNGDMIVFAEGSLELPSGYYFGVLYIICDLWQLPSGMVNFNLSESVEPLMPGFTVAKDMWKEYPCRYNPLILPTMLQVGVTQLNQSGAFLTGQHTPMELPTQRSEDFTLSYQSDENTQWKADNGKIVVTITKPKPIVHIRTEGRVRVHGTYFINSVKLYFKDQPEANEYKLHLSPQSNQTMEVEIWFSEILKGKKVDLNSILKFYNTLIFRDGSEHGVVANSWRLGERQAVQKYSEIINEFFTHLYLNPRRMLRGTLIHYEPLGGSVLLESHTNAMYVINSYIWNLHRSTTEVSLHEIGDAGVSGVAFSNGFSNGFL